MNDELEALRRRVAELEWIEKEYRSLKRAIDRAALEREATSSTDEIALYVDSQTWQIVDFSAAALESLGYSAEQLVAKKICDLEVQDEFQSAPDLSTHVDDPNALAVYHASFRRKDESLLPFKVIRQVLDKDGRQVLRYYLTDRALPERSWDELQWGGDAGYRFQQKLKILDEITIELSQIDSRDELCYRAVYNGIHRLGFDRMSIWFADLATQTMTGSYGVDEQGNIRDERSERIDHLDTYLVEFLNGVREFQFLETGAPLYNHQMHQVGTGWHLAVPMFDGIRCIGAIMVDNLLRARPVEYYEPELLRIYGMTVGHMITLLEARQKAFETQMHQGRLDMLRRFIMDIGHEFRTPLAIINTNTYLLSHAADESKKQSLIAITQEQVRYVSRMLDDILKLVSLENEAIAHFSPAEINHVVQDVIKMHAPSAAEYQVEVAFTPSEPITLMINATYLRDALAAILKNAFQHTPAEGRISVRIIPYADEVGICVQDNGEGIDSQYHEKIFDPLFRIDQARTERRSGLGLSIARAIIQAHRGRITVDSAPGMGSRFEIILPKGHAFF